MHAFISLSLTHLPLHAGLQMQAAAKRIFDQFLSPSASHPINVDDRVQKAVEQQMGNPLPNIFHEAQEQVSDQRDHNRTAPNACLQRHSPPVL